MDFGKLLEIYHGALVRLEVLADKEYTTHGKHKYSMRGIFLSDQSSRLGIYIQTSGYGRDLGCSTTSFIPYLGEMESVWQLRRAIDGVILLEHKPIGEGQFKVLGPNRAELGEIYGVNPDNYQTSYINGIRDQPDFNFWRSEQLKALKMPN